MLFLQIITIFTLFCAPKEIVKQNLITNLKTDNFNVTFQDNVVTASRSDIVLFKNVVLYVERKVTFYFRKNVLIVVYESNAKNINMLESEEKNFAIRFIYNVIQKSDICLAI